MTPGPQLDNTLQRQSEVSKAAGVGVGVQVWSLGPGREVDQGEEQF